MLLLVTDAGAAIGAIRCQQDFVFIIQHERAHKNVFYIICWLVGHLLVASSIQATARVLQCSSVLDPKTFSFMSVTSSYAEPKISILPSQSWTLKIMWYEESSSCLDLLHKAVSERLVIFRYCPSVWWPVSISFTRIQRFLSHPVSP